MSRWQMVNINAAWWCMGIVMKSVWCLCAMLLCFVIAGCFYVKYPRGTTAECKQWASEAIANKFHPMKSSEIVNKFPDVYDRYEYFICINRVMHPSWVFEDIFHQDAVSAARIIGDRLDVIDAEAELYLALRILYDLHVKRKYDLVGDKVLFGKFMKSSERMHDPTNVNIVGRMLQNIVSNKSM